MFYGCNLSGSALEDVISDVNATTSLFHNIPVGGLSVGVLIANCRDVQLLKITVAGTPGLGILGINWLGTSILGQVMFTNNVPSECDLSDFALLLSMATTGGGMYLLYTDFRSNSNSTVPDRQIVDIVNTTFEFNQDCSLYNYVPQYYETSELAQEVGYRFGSSAGFGLELAQLTYSVNVTVKSTVFYKNMAEYNGGALHVSHFQGSSDNHVAVSNCSFFNNGFQAMPNVSSYVGALAIYLNNELPSEEVYPVISSQKVDANIFTILDTKFIENTATLYGVAYIFSDDSPFTTFGNENRIVFQNCSFQKNTAQYGTLLGIVAQKFSGQLVGVQVYMMDLEFTGNEIVSLGEDSATSSVFESLIYLMSVNVTVSGNNQFLSNKGTVFLAITSTIYIQGCTLFADNFASVGGAFQLLSESLLVIDDHTNLTFNANAAASKGGAIFVDLALVGQESLNQPDCFLWFDQVDYLCDYSDKGCPNIVNMDIHVSFINNTAPLGGAVYGSTLNSCSWFAGLENTVGGDTPFSSGLAALSALTQQAQFVFIPPLSDGITVVATDAKTVTIFNASDTVSVQPGQNVYLNITAFDGFGQRVPLAITSSVLNQEESGLTSTLGLSGYWFLSGSNDTLTQAVFNGMINTNATVTISAVSSFATTDFVVHLKDCNLGHVFVDGSCVCDPIILGYGVTCNSSSGHLLVPDGFYFGLNPVDGYVYQECLPGYCQSGLKSVPPFVDMLDVQCKTGYNRTSMLCSQCVNGTSVVEGSSRCLECDNSGLALIVPFLVGGLALMMTISFLNFTISVGFLNGIIFYSNVLFFYIPYFLPFLGVNNGIFTPIAFFNFHIGVEICIYNKMDTLAQTSIQLLFPLYLFVLMVLIIYLSRRSKRISQTGFSAARTFSTLLLMCYSTIGKACAEILGFIKFDGPIGVNNTTYYGWLLDPNVRYGHGFHGFMVLVSVVLLAFYIFPFSIILLTPRRIVYRLRWGKRLIPMFDAFWAPFKPQLEIWLGFRCLLRIVTFVFSIYFPFPINTFTTDVLIICLHFLQYAVQPFAGKWQNHFETFYMVNLILLLLGLLFFGMLTNDQMPDSSPQVVAFQVYTYFLLIVAYLMFSVIFAIHLHLKFPNLLQMIQQKLREHCCKKGKDISEKEEVHRDEQIENVQLQKVNYSELREPLLDDSGTCTMVVISPDSVK